MKAKILLLILVLPLKGEVYQYEIPGTSETQHHVVWVDIDNSFDVNPYNEPWSEFYPLWYWRWIFGGYYDFRSVTITQPPTTLVVSTDGQNITGATLLGSRWQPYIPFWFHQMMNDRNWLLHLDQDDGVSWTPELAFNFLPALSRIAPPLIKAVARRGGKWAVVGVLATETVTREEAQNLVEMYILLTALNVTLTRANPESTVSAIAYIKPHPQGYRYSGRAIGWGSPTMVMARRDAEHIREGRGDYFPGIVNAAVVTKGIAPEAFAATRGREQSLIDRYRAAGLAPHNLVRSVAQNNPNGYTYHLTSVSAFGWIWDYTGWLPTGFSVWPPKQINYIYHFSLPPL